MRESAESGSGDEFHPALSQKERETVKKLAPNRARAFFRQGLAESFGRHIRALERWLIEEQEQNLTRIYVLPSNETPQGLARLMIPTEVFEKRSGVDSCVFPANRTQSEVTVRTIYIVVGTLAEGREDETQARPDIGYASSNYELHFTPEMRLALAHELGHIALGHLISPNDTLEVPKTLTKNPELESGATLYGIALTLYSGSFFRRDEMKEKLIPDSDGLQRAASAIWGRHVDEGTHLGDLIREVLADPDFLDDFVGDDCPIDSV